MKRALSAILIFCLTAGILSACGNTSGLTRYQATFLELFDTVTVVAGYEKDRDTFSKKVQEIHDQLETYHQLFDIYDDYDGISNIKTINDNAGVAPVKVDEKIIDMLELAVGMYHETDGMVNVAMGSVLALWHDAREAGIDDPENARLPSQADLRAAAGHMNIDDLQIDRENGTVYLSDPEMRLDVGAVAKGYAVEAVSRFMQENGMANYVLSVGGNIRAVGPQAGGEGWKLSVEDPNNPGGSLLDLRVSDMAVVTSGVYQRYYTVAGVRYHHIIDPVSLYPKNEYVSVTVLSDDSGVADALSTALFNMGQTKGLALIESLPDTEAMWVYADGTKEFSSGFEHYIISE
jgi:thiamine biosynthesis lipoprotein